MSMLALIIVIAVLLTGVVLIAGLCFLGYFLYKKHEEKKENYYEE